MEVWIVYGVGLCGWGTESVVARKRGGCDYVDVWVLRSRELRDMKKK